MSASASFAAPRALIRESLRIAGQKVSRDRVIEVRHPYTGELAGTVAFARAHSPISHEEKSMFRSLSRLVSSSRDRSHQVNTAQCRPTVEALEDRRLLSGNVQQTNLVSDLPGVAQVLDPAGHG